MTEPHVFSASQLKLAAACRRAWVLRYLHRRKEPTTSSLVFGTLVHLALEAHFRGKPFSLGLLDDGDARAFLDAMPSAKRDAMVNRAQECALVAIPSLPKPKPSTLPEAVLTVTPSPAGDDVVLLRGSRDLVDVLTTSIVVYDYKTTKGRQDAGRFDPWGYALTPETLRADLQANIYAVSTMLEYGVDVVTVRWVYICVHPARTPIAKTVEAQITYDDALRVVWPHLVEAQQLIPLTRLSTPPPIDDFTPHNPHLAESPCQAYGGCKHRVTRGGVCDPDPDGELLNEAISASL